MSTAREEILDRIRRANANAGVTRQNTPASRINEPASPTGGQSDDVLAMFCERTADYKALVEQCPTSGVAERVAAAVAKADGVLLPEGLDAEWTAQVPQENVEADPGTPQGLDAIEAVVTTCAAAIAETGTIVLDHAGGQGRRALTLVPDLHVCLVRASQIHPDVPAAVAALRGSIEAGRALTWISGPSATSDIELSRVEGVHGPRRLHVLVVTDG